MRNRKRQGFAAGGIVSIAVFCAAVWLFLNGTSRFLGHVRSEGAETLRKAIARACVQCYAIEGRYPPSVEYLTEQYGIQIDEEQYYVFYSGFASNLMPEITVIPVEKP